MESQVDLFKKTVEEYLPPHVESQARLSKHMSKSIFLVVMGSNDYGFTFFKKINSTNPLDYTYAADYLLEKLADRLEVHKFPYHDLKKIETNIFRETKNTSRNFLSECTI